MPVIHLLIRIIMDMFVKTLFKCDLSQAKNR